MKFNAVLIAMGVFGFSGVAQPASSGGPVCSAPTSAKFETQLGEHNLKNLDASNNLVKASWEGNSFLCVYPRGKNPNQIPEIAFVLGNRKNLEIFEPMLRAILQLGFSAAAASHRQACLYILSKETLARLASRNNLQRVFIFGHGENGNLIDSTSNSKIFPSEIPIFNSKGIRAAHFFSCQARQRLSDWKRVFQVSNAELELSSDNILVVNALDRMISLFFDLGNCKI